MPKSSEIEGLLSRAADEMRAEGQNGWPIICDDAAAELRRLSTEVQELRAALRPFAEVAERIAAEHPGWDRDDFQLLIAGSVPVKLGPYRRARTALKPETVK